MSGARFLASRIAVVTALLFAGSCLPVNDVAFAQRPVTLRGRVTTQDGVVIPMGVVVTLETAEGMPVAKRPADASGQFSFEGLRVMGYKITVTCDGFETQTQEVNLEYGSDESNLNVYLNPLRSRKATKAAALLSDAAASKTAVKEFERGESALQKKHFPEARKFFERALADTPCYARALDDLALVDAEEKHVHDAEGHFQQAIRCDGALLDSYSELAELYIAQKKYTQSVAVLQLAIQRSPNTWQFHYQLGADHYHLGQYAQAEQEYLRAKSLNVSIPAEIHVKLADVYLKQSAYDKAYAEMQAYVRAEPDGPFAAKLKSVMHRMESDHILETAQPAAGRASAGPQP